MNPALLDIPLPELQEGIILINPRKIVCIKRWDAQTSQVFLDGMSPIRVGMNLPDLARIVDNYFHQRTLL